MKDYILFMHNDSGAVDQSQWPVYFSRLSETGMFQGGSSIGGGLCVSEYGDSKQITAHLSGYIKVTARDLEHAKVFVKGNPVFEAGGTVEIRELPRD